MPKDKNNNREMTPDEKFRSFFSTTAVDIPEAMTRRDEEEPEEKPQKRFGLFGRSRAKQQAGQPADLPLEMPTGEVLLGGAAEPEPEADLELVLKPTADPELLPFREEPQTEAGGKTQVKKPEPVPAAPQPEPPAPEPKPEQPEQSAAPAEKQPEKPKPQKQKKRNPKNAPDVLLPQEEQEQEKMAQLKAMINGLSGMEPAPQAEGAAPAPEQPEPAAPQSAPEPESAPLPPEKQSWHIEVKPG